MLPGLFQNRQGLGKAGSGGKLTSFLPLKFGAEIRNCMWRPPYIALTIGTISKGGGESRGIMSHDKT